MLSCRGRLRPLQLATLHCGGMARSLGGGTTMWQWSAPSAAVSSAADALIESAAPPTSQSSPLSMRTSCALLAI